MMAVYGHPQTLSSTTSTLRSYLKLAVHYKDGGGPLLYSSEPLSPFEVGVYSSGTFRLHFLL